ncbi:hypothetical protein GCM10009678_55690 [Actinomadura kijaniata]
MEREGRTVPSPEGAVQPRVAQGGRTETARPAGMPGVLSVVSPLSRRWSAWRARRLLNRLERRLHAHGWATQRRYAETPVLLRVFLPEVAIVGESIAAVRDVDGWSYQASTGEWLSSCADPELAATKVTALFAWAGLCSPPNAGHL